MPSEIGLRRYIPYKDEVGTTDSGGSSGLPDDMPDDYEGDVTEADIQKMLEDDTSEGATDD